MPQIIAALILVLALAACLPAPADVSAPSPVASPTATVARTIPETPGLPTPTATRVVRSTPAPAQTVSGTPTPTRASQNPFGLMIGPDALGLDRRLALAKSLGGAYFRPVDLFVDQWRGVCADCPAIERSGLKALLTVRANGTPQTATKPPTDHDAFKRSILDIIDKQRLEVLVVENEELSVENFYAGLPHEYAAELKTACEAAHLRRIKCTNGGLVSGDVVLLVWAHYAEKYNPSYACAYVQRTLDAQTAGTLCNARRITQLPPKLQGSVNRARAFLPLYKMSGADYLNFHWYVADAQALEEAVTYLRQATGLPVISNEMGQQTDNAAIVQPLLQKALDLGLPYVIWYSVDAPKARGLNNPDGSLRATGKMFQEFMQARFK